MTQSNMGPDELHRLLTQAIMDLGADRLIAMVPLEGMKWGALADVLEKAAVILQGAHAINVTPSVAFMEHRNIKTDGDALGAIYGLAELLRAIDRVHGSGKDGGDDDGS